MSTYSIQCGVPIRRISAGFISPPGDDRKLALICRSTRSYKRCVFLRGSLCAFHSSLDNRFGAQGTIFSYRSEPPVSEALWPSGSASPEEVSFVSELGRNFTCFSALSGIDGEGFCWRLYDGCAATHLNGPKTSRAVVQGAAANGCALEPAPTVRKLMGRSRSDELARPPCLWLMNLSVK